MTKFYLDIEVYRNDNGKPCVNLLDTESGYANEIIADSIEEVGTKLVKELSDYFEILDDIKQTENDTSI